MKKYLVMFLMIVVFLCGCELEQDFLNAENNASDSTVSNATTGAPASFSEYVMDYTDVEGYSFHVVCKVSPWILQSNAEVLNATWDSIADGQELPTINTWGFQKHGDSYSYTEYYTPSFNAKIDDMYYALGTIEITNVTEGFSFTPERPGYPKVQILKDAFVRYGEKLITRVYFGSEGRTSTLGIIANAKMTSNQWGPVPFVIAYAEHYTPNNPNGENYEKVETLPFYLCHLEVSNTDNVQMIIKHLEENSSM